MRGVRQNGLYCQSRGGAEGRGEGGERGRRRGKRLNCNCEASQNVGRVQSRQVRQARTTLVSRRPRKKKKKKKSAQRGGGRMRPAVPGNSIAPGLGRGRGRKSGACG